MTDAEEESPGGFLGVNNDDDSPTEEGNGVTDLEETGPDPDLRPLWHSFEDTQSGTVFLKVCGGDGQFRVYEDAARDHRVYFGPDDVQSWPADEFPHPLYVEGIAHSTAVGEACLEIWYEDDSGSGDCT